MWGGGLQGRFATFLVARSPVGGGFWGSVAQKNSGKSPPKMVPSNTIGASRAETETSRRADKKFCRPTQLEHNDRRSTAKNCAAVPIGFARAPTKSTVRLSREKEQCNVAESTTSERRGTVAKPLPPTFESQREHSCGRHRRHRDTRRPNTQGSTILLSRLTPPNRKKKP